MNNYGVDDRTLDSYEKAVQEYSKERADYLWLLFLGVGGGVALVGFGIYFSQLAISMAFGATGVMQAFGWSASSFVSAFEVAVIKIFGKNARAEGFKLSNLLEHKVALSAGIAFFTFDIFTNWFGLYDYALAMKHATTLPFFDNILTYILILFLGFLMGISEILVGIAIRSAAIAYVGKRLAKIKVDAYDKNIVAAAKTENARESRNQQTSYAPVGQTSPRPYNNKPKQNFRDINREQNHFDKNEAEKMLRQRMNEDEE